MMDYTWDVTMRNSDGKFISMNRTDRLLGCRRSWYKTEKAARKEMNWWYNQAVNGVCTQIKWVLYYRHNGIISIIDFSK